MSYAIMRIEKIKCNNDFAYRIKHNFREYQNSAGVDKDRTKYNLHAGMNSYKDVKAHLDTITKKANENRKVRKDAVRGLEILFASDRHFFQNQKLGQDYFRACLDWVLETFGKENFLAFDIHADEQGALHAHCVVTTLTKDGTKFDVKQWINGKQSLIALQDNFYSRVKGFGLQRGVSSKYTDAMHLTKKEFADLLEKDKQFVSKMSEKERTLYAIEGLRSIRAKQRSLGLNKGVNLITDEKLEKDLIAETVDISSLDFDIDIDI